MLPTVSNLDRTLDKYIAAPRWITCVCWCELQIETRTFHDSRVVEYDNDSSANGRVIILIICWVNKSPALALTRPRGSCI